MSRKPNLPTVLWALLILILCGMPGRDIPHFSFLDLLAFDKWVHAGIFFVLVVLAIRGFRLQGRSVYIRKNAVFLAAGLSVLYGGLMELMQGAFFAERTPDFNDFIANSFGCVMAVLLYPLISKRFPKLRLPAHA